VRIVIAIKLDQMDLRNYIGLFILSLKAFSTHLYIVSQEMND